MHYIPASTLHDIGNSAFQALEQDQIGRPSFRCRVECNWSERSIGDFVEAFLMRSLFGRLGFGSALTSIGETMGTSGPGLESQERRVGGVGSLLLVLLSHDGTKLRQHPNPMVHAEDLF